MQITSGLTESILNAIIAAAGPLDPAACFVGVGSAVNDRGIATTMADITPCTGALANAQGITSWGAPYFMIDGRAVTDGATKVFRPAAGDTEQVIFVWFLSSAAQGGNLLAYGRLQQPIGLADNQASWSLVPRITVDPRGRWSAEVMFGGS